MTSWVPSHRPHNVRIKKSEKVQFQSLLIRMFHIYISSLDITHQCEMITACECNKRGHKNYSASSAVPQQSPFDCISSHMEIKLLCLIWNMKNTCECWRIHTHTVTDHSQTCAVWSRVRKWTEFIHSQSYTNDANLCILCYQHMDGCDCISDFFYSYTSHIHNQSFCLFWINFFCIL